MTTASERDAEALLLRNQNYRDARKWAFENMSDEDLSTYNALVAEPATRDAGIDLLYSRWLENRAAAETAPSPELPQPRSPDLYYSQADMTAAMRDPRYQSDPRYREEVAYRVYQSKAGDTWRAPGGFTSREARPPRNSATGCRTGTRPKSRRRKLNRPQNMPHASRAELSKLAKTQSNFNSARW